MLRIKIKPVYSSVDEAIAALYCIVREQKDSNATINDLASALIERQLISKEQEKTLSTLTHDTSKSTKAHTSRTVKANIHGLNSILPGLVESHYLSQKPSTRPKAYFDAPKKIQHHPYHLEAVKEGIERAFELADQSVPKHSIDIPCGKLPKTQFLETLTTMINTYFNDLDEETRQTLIERIKKHESISSGEPKAPEIIKRYVGDQCFEAMFSATEDSTPLRAP